MVFLCLATTPKTCQEVNGPVFHAPSVLLLEELFEKKYSYYGGDINN